MKYLLFTLLNLSFYFSSAQAYDVQLSFVSDVTCATCNDAVVTATSNFALNSIVYVMLQRTDGSGGHTNGYNAGQFGTISFPNLRPGQYVLRVQYDQNLNGSVIVPLKYITVRPFNEILPAFCNASIAIVLDSNGFYPDLSGNIVWNATTASPQPFGYRITLVKFIGNDVVANTFDVGNTLSFNIGALTAGTRYGLGLEAIYFNGNIVCSTYREFTTTPLNGALYGGPAFTKNVSCNGGTDGSIWMGANGGFPPYQYSINGGVSYINDNIYNNSLQAGTYSIKVKDSQNYIFDGGIVTITQPTAISTTYSTQNLTATVTSTGGVPPYTWSLDNLTYGSSNTFTVSSPQTITIFTKDANNCVLPTNNIVLQVATPLINGNQAATVSLQAGSTLSNIVIDGAPNVIWYAVPATVSVTQNLQDQYNRNSSSDVPLSPNTVLVNGTTYYAAQVINGYESPTRLAVTVNLTGSLSINSADFENLKFFPNPVNDILNINNSSIIKEITITSMQGQEVLNRKPNSQTANVDVSFLATGIYIVKIKSEGKEKNIKILK